MSKKNPQLRFEGFTDDWEQRKLIDYLEVSKEKNKNEVFGKEDVLSVSGDYGIVNQIEFQGRSFAGASVAPYGIVDTGDIVYTKSPLKSNPYGIIKANKGKTGIVSTLYAVYKPLDNVCSDFVQIYFEQDARMNNYMRPLVNKGAKNDMKVSDVNALKGKVCFPSKYEQIKISEHFAKLDRLITLHQRKLDLLKEQKKGFLQKMFPKNGEKVPELRFAGFADDWEERKLGELALVLTGFPFKNEDFVDNGKYLVITNGNIQNESSTVDVSLGNRVDDLSDEIKERYYLNKNDILVTMDGTVGRTAKVVDDNLILAQRVARLVANKNTEFVYQWLNQGSFFNEMTKVSHGGTIKHISLNEISNYSATVPSNNIEQQKIGSFFKQLDDTIALHQRKLDLLKEQKKGFLQKMFV